MLLKPKHTDNAKVIVFLIVCKMYFALVYRSVRLEGFNKYGKKGITSAMECVDLATFTFAT